MSVFLFIYLQLPSVMWDAFLPDPVYLKYWVIQIEQELFVSIPSIKIL